LTLLRFVLLVNLLKKEFAKLSNFIRICRDKAFEGFPVIGKYEITGRNKMQEKMQ